MNHSNNCRCKTFFAKLEHASKNNLCCLVNPYWKGTAFEVAIIGYSKINACHNHYRRMIRTGHSDEDTKALLSD